MRSVTAVMAVSLSVSGCVSIAERAGLDERYVREWLGAMATAGIVQYEPTSRTFLLPPEHAVVLTGTSSRNLAANSQALAMLAMRLGKLSLIHI